MALAVWRLRAQRAVKGAVDRPAPASSPRARTPTACYPPGPLTNYSTVYSTGLHRALNTMLETPSVPWQGWHVHIHSSRVPFLFTVSLYIYRCGTPRPHGSGALPRSWHDMIIRCGASYQGETQMVSIYRMW